MADSKEPALSKSARVCSTFCGAGAGLPAGNVLAPVSLASRRSLFDSKSQNHELQFISPEKEWLGGAFDMVAGLYYFEEDFGLSEELNLGTSFCGVLVPAGPARTACSNFVAATGGIAATDQDVFQNVKSFAIYGQGNIHLADALTLTLGGRWTSDRKEGTYAQASSPFTQTLRATEVLTFPGIKEDRFTRIEGVADTDPFNPKDKFDPRNRRMSITVLNQDPQ